MQLHGDGLPTCKSTQKSPVSPNYAEQEQCHKGLRLLEQGDIQLALKEFNNALLVNHQNRLAWYYKGYIQLIVNQFDDALHALTSAAELNAQNDKVWHAVGYALYKLGVHRDASEAFEYAIALNPANAGAWFGKACIHATQNEQWHIIESLAHIVRLDNPLHALIYLLIARCEPALNTILTDQDYITAFHYSYNPDCSVQKELHDMMQRWYGNGIEPLHPTRYEQASMAFEQEIHRNPSNAQAWVYKGYALVEQNKMDEALAAFEHARYLNETVVCAAYWYCMSRVHLTLHNTDLSLKALQEALKLDIRLKDYAQADQFFAPLHRISAFKQLVSFT